MKDQEKLQKIQEIRAKLHRKLESDLTEAIRGLHAKLDEDQESNTAQVAMVEDLVKSLPDLIKGVIEQFDYKDLNIKLDWTDFADKFKDAFPTKTQIDWENKPKEEKITEIAVNNPEAIYEPVQEALAPLGGLFGKISNLLTTLYNRIEEMLREPDEMIIGENKITEYYKKRKVEYELTIEDGKLRRVRRNES